MILKRHIRRLIWPSLLTVGLLSLLIHPVWLAELVGDEQTVTLGVTALTYFSAAWLISRSAAFALDQASARRRPYPRLLKDLIATSLFVIAFVATVSLFMGQGAFGAFAGWGLVLALLGFAIRNVVADTLSGIALGVEAPFRIGDWIEIDGLARGKVVEIGWRTTRLATLDRTYLILPNSQIARQRITNYSAPKPEYRVQLRITLDHSMPIARAREVIQQAMNSAKLIRHDPAPDVRVLAYEEGGITYSLRYWLSRFDHEVDCRDEVFTRVDEALRAAGSVAPYRRIEMVPASGVGRPSGS